MRILLNPAPVEGGGAPNPNPAEPAAPQPPATPPPAPKPEAPNPLLAELAALKSRLAEFEGEKAAREEAERRAAEEKALAKGEFDKLIKQRDEQLAAERKAKADAVDRSKAWALNSQLALALSRHDLVESGAEDLSALWRGDFEVVPDGDGWKVQSKDLRPVAEVVAERLGSPRYAHYVKAGSRGGSGGGGGQRPAPTNQPDPAGRPLSYEQQVMAQWQAAQEALQQGPSWMAPYRPQRPAGR